MSEGDSEGSGASSTRDGAEPSEFQRAEELIEEWGQRVGVWLSRVTARAREEAEDIWAEAQNIRHG
ncbi:MAG: hypothetical protein JWN32_2322 [Solirubrobacterales bacterium]|nr:hypothetical protein [Solirubrobacterales bacterium]